MNYTYKQGGRIEHTPVLRTNEKGNCLMALISGMLYVIGFWAIIIAMYLGWTLWLQPKWIALINALSMGR